MAFAFGTHFFLFLWFSGVNHFVNPSSDAAGSGLEPDYSSSQQHDDMMQMEDRRVYKHYQNRFIMPPSHADPIEEPLRRQYRLEDFLWNGSGDGPHPSEQDGGLAWEDNGGGFGGGPPNDPSRSWIRITKTMTVYRTVLATKYPVEVTPTVISGLPPQPTPRFSDSLSSGFFSDSATPVISISPSTDSQPVPTENVLWIPTPTFSPSPPEPTMRVTLPPPPTSTDATTTRVHPQQPLDNLSAESTDLMYWIQTSIKANDSAFRDAPKVFQSMMQKSLARVYASAFKRHLLSTLGVLPPPSPTKNSSKRRRRKRWSYGDNNGFEHETLNSYNDHIHQWLYVAQSSMSPTQLRNLATAAMNVTVSILNVSMDEPEKEVPKKLDLRYVVLAEGNPVPAFSAVKELDLVTKEEMEKEIGYEIINKKAEALVAGPPEQMTRNDQQASTSPWLIVAVTTICLLVILLALIAFMVWKWKHNRLADSNNRRVPPAPRPQSGIIEIEEGVINPAFLGTPSLIGRGVTHEESPKPSPVASLLSARIRTAKKISDVLSKRSFRIDSAKGRRRGKGDVDDDDDDDASSDKRKRKSKKLAKEKEVSPTSSEDLRLHKRKPVVSAGTLTSSEGSAEWKELLGEPKTKLTSRIRQRSPMRAKGQQSASTGASGTKAEGRRDMKEKRRRRKTQISSKIEEAVLKTDEDDSEWSESSGGKEDTGESPKAGGSRQAGQQQQQPWTRGTTDAISLGNLDICQDTIAQTPSDYAKKLVPWKRPGSAVASSGSSGAKAASGSDGGSRRPGSRVALPATIEEIPSFDLTEDDEKGREQDRDLSEKSFDLKDSPDKSANLADTKDAQVQTPTRISKTASHKARAAPKPRRSWRGSPGAGEGPSESVISTESEEIVEVHHINSSMSDDQNPLGRMRKRFHQFLDDAFNVMVAGGKRDDADNRAETQSAKVSICHEVVETETEWRPWSSHVVREESMHKLRRPKSAAVPIGPPKRAWTASSERRTHSAKSKVLSDPKSTAASRVPSTSDIPATGAGIPLPEDDDEEETYDKTSTPCTTARDEPPRGTGGAGGGGHTTTSNTISDPSQTHSSVVISPAFIFPQYPAYPDIRVNTPTAITTTVSSASLSQSSHTPLQHPQTPSTSLPPPTLPSNDPAVPLIQAIKDEMKRFEKEPSSH